MTQHRDANGLDNDRTKVTGKGRRNSAENYAGKGSHPRRDGLPVSWASRASLPESVEIEDLAAAFVADAEALGDLSFDADDDSDVESWHEWITGLPLWWERDIDL
ncbi:MAG: hypothetical protein KGL39_41325 [Patescibacteria group bacterium]|nr:hypothetical protein [Patescibacteria group bacterium]